MILHEYYFSNLRRAADPAPAGASALAQALTETFGSVDDWRTAFQVMGEMRGIGWVILFQDGVTHQLSNHWITLHQQGVPAGFKPLLVMDVWEHAFMRDYKATERNKYVEAFFSNMIGRWSNAGSWQISRSVPRQRPDRPRRALGATDRP